MMDAGGKRTMVDQDTEPVRPAMSCEEVDRLLPGYIDGLLPIDVAQAVTDHLLACDGHRANNWEAVIHALRREAGRNTS
jgi:hypothetical protein